MNMVTFGWLNSCLLISYSGYSVNSIGHKGPLYYGFQLHFKITIENYFIAYFDCITMFKAL